MSIPLDTPPGTQIVCIDDHPRYSDDTFLSKGSIYTIQRWKWTPGGMALVLEERRDIQERIRLAANPSRFRLLDLPKELTDLLTAAPAELERAL